MSLCEPFAVVDTFCTGLDHVEDAGGGNLRYYLYGMRDGERFLAACIVAPIASLPDAMTKFAEAFARFHGPLAKAFPLLDLMIQ